jgi:hypothetical protein
MELIVHTDGKQYLVSPLCHYDSYVIVDGPLHDKPQELSVEDSIDNCMVKEGPQWKLSPDTSCLTSTL